MISKKVSDSRTEQVQLLTQADLNGYNRLFGGRLMEWIDIVAGVTARRHCNSNITTVSIDKLHFGAPARANDVVVLQGHITYVGYSSMEVCVKSYVEHLSGERSLINTAYVNMVALDENERPIKVPDLDLVTDEEREEWTAGSKRYELRKRRTAENF